MPLCRDTASALAPGRHDDYPAVRGWLQFGLINLLWLTALVVAVMFAVREHKERDRERAEHEWEIRQARQEVNNWHAQTISARQSLSAAATQLRQVRQGQK
jgi:hypothetical protein